MSSGCAWSWRPAPKRCVRLRATSVTGSSIARGFFWSAAAPRRSIAAEGRRRHEVGASERSAAGAPRRSGRGVEGNWAKTRSGRFRAQRRRRPEAERTRSRGKLKVMLTREQISDGLKRARYVTNERVETAIFLALALEKPLLIEGPAGAGKTEVAKVLAEMLHTELIRLQCYEGLDEARALYEWNYQKQLLRMQPGEQQGLRWEELSEHIFSRDYLLERPLLKAITAPSRVVLLIDEVDKADEEFEAFLLELLSDFQISVPELGTLKAHERPVVILTSNRARELSEALRRRCLHLFIDFPGIEQERKIIEFKVPELDAKLAAEAARFVSAIRKLGLRKPPSIAETLDWARALVRLGVRELDTDAVRTALGVLLKHEEDRVKVESKASALAPRRR